MERNRETGVVIDRRIRTCYLCFISTPISIMSLVFSEEGIRRVRVKYLQYVPCEFSFYRLLLCYS